MEKRNKKQFLIRVRPMFLLMMYCILLLGMVNFTSAAQQDTIATGLKAAVGTDLDESKNHLYFVEYTTGKLRRIDLSSGPSYSIDMIASGFSHPEDVQLDLDHGFAYVTTRDAPGTGALWKVDISTGTKNLVTFNLGGPQQLFLDIPNNQAYTVGYNDGRLRCIDLTTGVKTPIITGLGHPVGLAITDDGQYAYVTEQNAPARISKIDLTMGVIVSDIIPPGLTAPFFLAWTDNSQVSLYVVERDPANKISRVDLTTATKYDAITGLPWRPSGIAVSSTGTPVYVTTDKMVVKVDMVEFDLTEPVFLGIGHVPYSCIVDGYATTDPGYFFKVKHAPFGGSLNFFGNLSHFKTLGATHYKILISKDGGIFDTLTLSWNAYKWNPDPLIAKYELVPVAPEPGTKQYLIPAEYPLHAGWWYPPFLFMRWPSGNNGLYTFQVRIYDAVNSDITWKLPAAKNNLTVRIDNTPPDVKLLSIWIKGPPDKLIEPCDIVSLPNPNDYYFKITAYDPNGHFRYYTLRALWGDNKSGLVYNDIYANHEDPVPPHQWCGVTNFIVPRSLPGSTGSPSTWSADCNCAHTFYLRAGKRTINGYNYILHRKYHKSITINNTGVTCP